jgi:ABC-type nitrate/sulfonate/bicarbonate transport system permease component
MMKWRFYQNALFLALVVAFFLGSLTFDLTSSFMKMLWKMTMWMLPSALIGVAAALGILHNRRLTEAALRFLRLVMWLPFVVILAVPKETVIWTTIAASILCTCCNYLVARALLDFRGRSVAIYVGRETILQLFFFSLLAQLQLSYWIWQGYTGLAFHFQVLATIAVFVALVNLIFGFNFDTEAHNREIIVRKELESANRRSLLGAIVISIVCLLIWQASASPWISGSSVFPIAPASPLEAIKAAYNLFGDDEFWLHMQVSLIEILLGVFVCCLIAFAVGGLCLSKVLRSVLFFFLPLTLAPLVLVPHTLTFILVGIGLWNKALAVAFLTFYPFFETWWALRNHRVVFRILMALDAALPFAFVAMVFGEAMAATAGLGFSMIVHTYYQRGDKAFAVFLITVGLLVCLSLCLRWLARRFFTTAPTANAIPAQAA